MSQIADPALAAPRKRWVLPVVTGALMLVLGAGAGFALMRDPGLISFGGHGDSATSAPGLSYVALDPVVVNLPRASGRQLLRFTASLEVDPARQAEVEMIRPRIIDVMNSYLRAVDPADFEQQAILAQLRGQLLRRVQVVAGEGRVRDLLVIEFILN